MAYYPSGTINKIAENKFQWCFNFNSFQYPNYKIKSPDLFVNNVATTLFAKGTNTANTFIYNLTVSMANKPEEVLVKFTETMTSPQSVCQQTNKSYEMFKKYHVTEVSIVCEFLICKAEIVTNVIVPSMPEEALVLLESLEELLNNSKFSDLTIVVEDEEFRVHKSVLASRSKVFDAMLQEHTKEFKENKITIADIDCDTMKELLKFIYTAKVTDIEKMAYDLVKPADKYEINDLFVLCDKTLAKSISLNNIKSMLTLINLFNLRLVKEKVVEMLQDNLDFLEKQDFIDFLQELSPVLLTDIIVKTMRRHK